MITGTKTSMMPSEGAVVRRTRSVCPVCLRPLPAQLVERGGELCLEKTCPEHGGFSTPVWRNRLDFAAWCAGAQPLAADKGLRCPADCGICAEHEQGTCCALLEVTRRCNLHCAFCFAHGGESAEQPALAALEEDIRDLVRQRGAPLLQLSGGEPTLRDDLPELVAFAKAQGCPYVQINSNGIRLADDPAYVRRLKEAGLSFVFLQFDGVDDGVYRALRGEPLYETKLRAIRNCGEQRLGVTLVPTVVRGVNDGQLGDIVRLACTLSPAVRGVHFQPVSYFGRYPSAPANDRRYTLDELITDLCAQTGLAPAQFLPSRCDHPLCGFHGTFLVNETGGLSPLTDAAAVPPKSRTTAAQNREYVGRHWQRTDEPPAKKTCCCCEEPVPDLDAFLARVRRSSLTLTAMAFQDAMNFDIERLHRCSLHVYSGGRVKPFCANYLTAVTP